MQILKVIFLSASIVFCLRSEAQETGVASYISDVFEGKQTASGAFYRRDSMVCAHNTYPFGTMLKVTRLDNGRSVSVKVIDRGPGVPGRIVNLSRAAAARIDMIEAGVVRVEVEAGTEGGEVVYVWSPGGDSLQWNYSDIEPERLHVPDKSLENVSFELLDSGNNGQYVVTDVKSPVRDEAFTEEMLWQGARNLNKIDLYRAYVNTYPDGKYVNEAMEKIATLTKERGENIIEQIRGRLAYFIPDTMTVDREYRVGMEISADTSLANLREMIRSYGMFSRNETKVQAEIVRIGQTMRAVLADPSPEGNKKFNVFPFGESDRRNIQLTGSEPALWEWVVTPLQKGDHKLYFSIEIIAEGAGGQSSQVIPVKEAEVLVVVEPGFIQQYLRSILIALIALGAGALFLFRRKRKRQEEEIRQLPMDSIRQLIGDSRLIEAVDALHDAFERREGKAYREAALLKTRLESCEEKARKGILSNDEVTRERNKITDDLLALLENIRK